MPKKETSAYATVQAARAPRPYTTRELINGLVANFHELHGDRSSHDDPAVIGGIGWLDDQAVTVIATDKGNDLSTISAGSNSPSRICARAMLRH